MNFTKFSFSILCATLIYAEDTVQLDSINIQGSAPKADKEVFKKAKAVSAREDISNSTQNLDNIIRTIPGAFTNQDKSTGTIAPNIRGGAGLGRVNTMVDGITQTFYSSGVDDGKSGGTSQFGATIDPSFIAGVDVERGSFSGRNGINSLMGSVNFRTLGIDDIIKDDSNFGFITKFQAGNNAYKSNWMGALAGKEKFESGGQLGVVVGYGMRDVSQDYKAGGGVKIEDINKDELDRAYKEWLKNKIFFHYNPWPKGQTQKKRECHEYNGQKFCFDISRQGSGSLEEFIKDEDLGKDGTKWKQETSALDTKPFDPQKLKQKIKSNMVKVEFLNDNNMLNLSFRNLENKIWSRKIDSKSYQLNYTYTNNANMDLNFIAAFNDTKQLYKAGAEISGRELIADIKTENKSASFDISDTFRNEIKDAQIETTIGLNKQKVSYSKNRHPYELVWFDNYAERLRKGKNKKEELLKGALVDPPGDMFGNWLGFHPNCPTNGYRANTFQPDGKQDFFSIYANNSVQKDIYRLDFSINSLKYNYQGKYSKCVEVGKCDEGEFWVDDAGKRTAINYSGAFSAEIHDLFMPFISYSKSERVPNIQELYFSQQTIHGIQNGLKNEKAKTWQIGFNGFKSDLLKNGDVFGFKTLYYNTKIKNYIHTVAVPRYKPDNADPLDYPHLEFNNYDKVVKKRGIELEFTYDAGFFYTNLAYSRQFTTQPTSFSDVSGGVVPPPPLRELFLTGHGITRVSELPKDYGFLDTGFRFFGEKLTLGNKIKYYGPSKKAVYKDEDNRYITPENAKKPKLIRYTETIEKQPLIYDMYVSYEPIKNLTIKAEVQNVFDKKYIDPLDSNNDAASQRTYSMVNGERTFLNNFAKGRTAVLSLSYRY
ncbi:MAG: TonB-dependent receptor domain-containing protein [Campylobacter sp.]